MDGADPAEVWDQFADVAAPAGGVGGVGQLRLGRRAGALRWPAQVAEHFADDRDQRCRPCAVDPSDAMPVVRAMAAARRPRSMGVGAEGASSGCAAATAACSCSACSTTLVGFALASTRLDRRRVCWVGKAICATSARRRSAAPAERGQAGGAPLHRRGDLPGRQGLPRHAARHPAPAARPLHRAGRGAQHSIAESLLAAERAVKTSRAERETRLRDLEGRAGRHATLLRQHGARRCVAQPAAAASRWRSAAAGRAG